LENEAGIGDAGEWHLDIDKKELRWESYVKAGYYVGFPITIPNGSRLLTRRPHRVFSLNFFLLQFLVILVIGTQWR
jgi:hypothetical protein